MKINLERLTPDAVRCFDVAIASARERHNPYLDTEHLLLGALQSDIGSKAFATAGGSVDSIIDTVSNEISIVRETPLQALQGITKGAQTKLNQAEDIARSLGVNYLNSGHILLSLLNDPEPFIADILTRFPPLNITRLREVVVEESHPPSTVFEQRWRPNRWEHGYLFAAAAVGKRVAAPPQKAERPSGQKVLATISHGRERSQDTATRDLTPLFIVMVIVGVALYAAAVRPDIIVPVTIVAGGWMVSLVLHEFAHALVAYWGGDHTVADKGYLTLNPLKYMHPMLSLGLPLLFLALGGIGLPGGAVYIERHRLRNKWWGSAVSAAGPFANLICLIVFSAPFWTGYVSSNYLVFQADDPTFWGSVAFLVWIQGTAILFNLLPIPPLDGFGVIEPFLEPNLAAQLRSIGSMGFLLIIILIFWMPRNEDGFDLAGAFFDQADAIAETFEVQEWQAAEGWEAFRFWDNS